MGVCNVCERSIASILNLIRHRMPHVVASVLTCLRVCILHWRKGRDHSRHLSSDWRGATWWWWSLDASLCGADTPSPTRAQPGAPAGQTRATPRPGTATPSSVQCRAVWRLCTCHVAVATNTSQGDYNHAYTHSQRMSTTGSQSSIDFSMDTDLKISVSALRPDAHVLSQSR